MEEITISDGDGSGDGSGYGDGSGSGDGYGSGIVFQCSSVEELKAKIS